MLAITVGADPEVALTNTTTGRVVPCVGKIPGTKSSPMPVEGSRVGLMLQEDNVSIEFNIKPCTISDFRVNINSAIVELKKYITTTLGKEYAYSLGDAFKFTDKELESEQAKAFGCDPDFLAHERGMQRKPVSPKQAGNLRFFAGHLHIGYDRDKCPTPDWAIVQGMEAFQYFFTVVNGEDPQPSRRGFYGLPGLYRPKPYGLEYRTPSNRWLHNTNRAEMLLHTAEHIIRKPAVYQNLYSRVNWTAVTRAIETDGAEYKGRMYDDLTEMREELFDAPFEI